MANTYTQLYIQLVFAVTDREHLIPKQYKEQVQQYMTQVIQERNHKLLAINCMPDHTHIFIGQHPTQSLSDLVEQTKTAATKFIKKQYWMPFNFSWQRGFGAFSYSRSHIDRVVKYVRNQEEHHEKRTFREEYLDMLNKFDIDYDKKYTFQFYDDLYDLKD
jgi:REP element-mobilizing transposase RayT